MSPASAHALEPRAALLQTTNESVGAASAGANAAATRGSDHDGERASSQQAAVTDADWWLLPPRSPAEIGTARGVASEGDARMTQSDVVAGGGASTAVSERAAKAERADPAPMPVPKLIPRRSYIRHPSAVRRSLSS